MEMMDMSDDLVKRLSDVNRNYDLARGVHFAISEARDRIEALEAENAKLLVVLARLRAGLVDMAENPFIDPEGTKTYALELLEMSKV